MCREKIVWRNMNKKTAIVSAFLLAALCFAPVTQADGNNLVQMDVKKVSSDSVNVTLFTSDTYNGNIVVSKKSDNKYVLIMPNTSGKASHPDLSAVKDIVSDVDIKTVPDGNYTKITVITTKPITIKAHSQKSAPLSSEQLAMKQIINKAQTHTNAPVTQTQKAEQPTKVTSTKPAPQKAETPKTDVKKQETKPNAIAKMVEQKTKELTIKKEEKKVVNNAVKEQPKQVKEEKPLEEIKDIVPVFEPKTSTVTETAIKEIEQAAKTETPKKVPSTLPATLMMILFSVLGIGLFIRVIKESLHKSKALKKAFLENISQKPKEPVSYTDIINNKDMNWQERYKQFVDKAQASKTETKQAEYNFIPTPEALSPQNQEIEKETVSFEEIKLDEPIVDETKIEEKRSEFERIMEKHEHAQELQIQPKQKEEEPVKVEIEVKNEDVKIPEQLSKSINLKTFKNAVSLDESHRERIQTKLKRFEIVEDLDKRKNAEAKDNEVLGGSLLHSNPRTFKNPALNVSELMAKGKRILNETKMHSTMIQDPQDYVMSTVDEYFALLDKEKTEQIPNLAPERLDFSRPKQRIQKSGQMSNPMLRRTGTAESTSINGLVIKSGYEIDENRGFYLVSLDNASALIGRVGDEITVIKKFERSVDDLQVRLDSANIYMVKAGGFKSLVEAGKTKMGVLLEL